jgi:hypothetical protein
MSWTRSFTDGCAYAQRLTENVSSLSYVMDTAKYEHCRQCRSELGLVGGNNVSKATGNLVDLESNLFGIDRESSHCASMRYLPGEIHGKSAYKTVCYKDIDPTPKHLHHCQFFSYPGVPQPPALDVSKCPR